MNKSTSINITVTEKGSVKLKSGAEIDKELMFNCAMVLITELSKVYSKAKIRDHVEEILR